ncbi:hypothetical protein [Haloarcula montana]|uniref:hypothetical protein n=1 Tax=Haloarcula montana TaxID=3111776 RepID=UPI002D76B59D|nr:hypothetical protein [Haloarcula sp. GH36]
MTLIEDLTLGTHVVAGFVALGGGLGAFVTAKGGRRHRRFGMAYVYAMAVVSGTSLALYALDPTSFRLFLSLVAVFSFYFAFSAVVRWLWPTVLGTPLLVYLGRRDRRRFGPAASQ